jgi:hypothetical protein
MSIAAWRIRAQASGPIPTKKASSVAADRPSLVLGPQDPTALLVGDERQVVLALAVGQLVDTDGGDPGPVDRLAMPCHDALEDGSHGAPGDAQHLADRGLVAALRQPPDQLLERPRESGMRIRPGDLLDDHAAAGTVDPPELRLERQDPVPGIEVSPSGASAGGRSVVACSRSQSIATALEAARWPPCTGRPARTGAR